MRLMRSHICRNRTHTKKQRTLGLAAVATLQKQLEGAYEGRRHLITHRPTHRPTHYPRPTARRPPAFAATWQGKKVLTKVKKAKKFWRAAVSWGAGS